MLFPLLLVLRRGHKVSGIVAVLRFEGSVKTCVVTEAAFAANVVGLTAERKELTGYLQPLFLNVAVDAGAYLTVEFVT